MVVLCLNSPIEHRLRQHPLCSAPCGRHGPAGHVAAAAQLGPNGVVGAVGAGIPWISSRNGGLSHEEMGVNHDTHQAQGLINE